MSTRTPTRARKAGSLTPVLRSLLTEIRLLRDDLRSFAIPTERLEEYAHPERIRQSLKKALRQHPSRSRS